MKPLDLDALREIPDPIVAPPAAAPEVPEALAERLRETPSPTRSRTSQRRWVALGAALASGAAWLAALGVRSDLAALPMSYLVAWIALPPALALAAMALGVRAGRSGLGPRVEVARALAIALPIVVAAVALLLPEPPSETAAPSFVRALAACFNVSVVVAWLPILLAALAFQRGFASGARLRGALIGAAAGLFAAGVLNVHCPLVDRMHLVLSHALPVAVAALIGALAAHRFMRA